MRKRLWQIHAWFGLIAGLGLLVIGLTGSLLVFRGELEKFVNPELVRVEVSATGRLPMDTLLGEARRQLPDHEITGWLPQQEDPELADVLYVIRHGDNEWLLATLDPYTGRLLASPRLGTRTLTGWLLDLHYELLADHAGMLVAGLLGVALCLLGVTGVWLYREFWKHLLTLRWRKGARILFSDLHKFVGITSAALNLLLGFTGAYWNVTHVAGHWINGDPVQPRIEKRLYADSLSLEALMRDANTRMPGFRTHFISLPSLPDTPVITLWGAPEPRGVLTGNYGSTLTYDPQSGAHKTSFDLRTAGIWSRIVDAFGPLHFGTFGGLPVKILWALAGLAPGLLAVSGFVIWRLRRKASKDPIRTA